MKQFLGLAALLLLARSAMAQASGAPKAVTNPPVTSQSTVMSFAGCYELHIGRWWPWGFGSHDSNGGLPHRIELLTERGTDRFEEGELLIRAIPRKEQDSQRQESSLWEVQSATKVRLVWTTGFVGDAMNLHKNQTSLSGWDHPFFDAAKLIPRVAHVTARQISCNTAPPAN